MLKKLKEKQGYISLETVIIAGLMIGFGAYAMTALFSLAEPVVQNALTQISSVMGITFG